MRGGETTSLRIIAIGGGQKKNTELIREFAAGQGQVSGQDKKNIDDSRTERRLAPFPTPRNLFE
jgi:hypothetical protein